MGWREWMRNNVIASHGVNPSVTETDLAAAVLAMPPADRIALARELLEGTGKVVAEPVSKDEDNGTWDDYRRGERDGWNACRAIMLGDEG